MDARTARSRTGTTVPVMYLKLTGRRPGPCAVRRASSAVAWLRWQPRRRAPSTARAERPRSSGGLERSTRVAALAHSTQQLGHLEVLGDRCAAEGSSPGGHERGEYFLGVGILLRRHMTDDLEGPPGVWAGGPERAPGRDLPGSRDHSGLVLGRPPSRRTGVETLTRQIRRIQLDVWLLCHAERSSENAVYIMPAGTRSDKHTTPFRRISRASARANPGWRRTAPPDAVVSRFATSRVLHPGTAASRPVCRSGAVP